MRVFKLTKKKYICRAYIYFFLCRPFYASKLIDTLSMKYVKTKKKLNNTEERIANKNTKIQNQKKKTLIAMLNPM
jgi:hypothetical protein